MPSALEARIKQFARDAGFDLCGIAPVCEFRELEYFPEWIDSRNHGEMRYMESRDDAGELTRAALERVAPWARSVIVCVMNYNTAQPYSTAFNDVDRGWISRYAWSQEDYHEAVLRRLRQLEAEMHALCDSLARPESACQGEESEPQGLKPSSPRAASGTAEAVSFPKSILETPKSILETKPTDDWRRDTRYNPTDHCPPTTAHALQTRCYVDTGPLVERVYAKYAGIGWIAKNTCIINQKLGSWLFLGVILTSLELTADVPAPDRCGRCTRCLDACPTHAFIAPGKLDARLCISYLTIEKRGEIPEELRPGIGRHLFGCDICQDVCPWNRKAPATIVSEFQPRVGLVNPALDWLAEMKDEEFRRTFHNSPIRRTKLAGLRRNAVVAMGNSGEQKFLPTLKRLSEDTDPVLASHSKWAFDCLESECSGDKVPHSYSREVNEH